MRKFLKTCMLTITFIIIISSTSVFALEEEMLYINSNGVELTQKEYDFVNEFYGSNYFTNMTHEQYEWLTDLNINDGNVEIETIYSNDIDNTILPPYRNTYSTSSKRLSIAKSCDSICTVITSLTWLVNPATRSYDLIGARWVNTSMASDIVTTMLTSSSGTIYSSNNKIYSNGLGTSIKLPSGSTNIVLQQRFFTNLGGTVYASYQHAVDDVTLETSLNYTISVGGYGNVFYFHSGAGDHYDQMNGVNITL